MFAAEGWYPMFLTPNVSHKLNSKLAKAGIKPGPGLRTVPRLDVRLVMIGSEWQVIIGRGLPMPATDVEVELWKRLQEARG